ncbi:MAG TPA: hypothetical protein VND96_17025 [Candidatus Micrarchaeaceae archaeon]|nr:hypothetical protein [Candidatus Micrarchaeaceae archaeon]
MKWDTWGLQLKLGDQVTLLEMHLSYAQSVLVAMQTDRITG